MPEDMNDAIVEAIENVERPVARAKDIADQVSIGKRAVLNRLETLVDDDRVERLDVGAKGAVFWVEASDSSRSRSAVNEVGESELEGTRSPASEPWGNDVETAVERIFDAVFPEGVDLPGSGTKLDERREALRATVAYLVEQGTARRSEFEEDVYPEFEARYETSYSWWKNAIGPALSQVAGETEAIEAADHAGDWSFVGWN